jgi:signal transduction histidine kinase
MLNEALDAADIPADVEVVCHYDQQLPLVKCSLLLLDIFVELITNACKAMEGRKLRRLEVSSRSEQIAGLPWIRVDINDTGKGILDNNLKHLWNLFQPSNEGFGFGLWWMRTYIERQGGTIKCRSQPGKGATFSIRLPASEDRRQITESRYQKTEKTSDRQE